MPKQLATYRKKNVGQVFTPAPLVRLILDFVGYRGEVILQRHLIDNSCGEGAFLTEAVDRYCQQFLSRCHDKARLSRELSTYIHGIEIEPETHSCCLTQLDDVARHYGLTGVNWDVVCDNALRVNAFNGKMDFVVGNPPYVRVHNLKDNYDDVKRYAFAENGMTDLFIVFFEICFRMMSKGGHMALITPSSWLTSKAGEVLRLFLSRTGKFRRAIDLGHRQAFKSVTTYTLISYFENNPQVDTLDYYCFYDGFTSPRFVSSLKVADYHIRGKYYLGTADQLALLRRIHDCPIVPSVQVKNGFATLADSVFIGHVPDSPITIPVLKASTGVWTRGLFPYTLQGNPLAWSAIQEIPAVAKYLESKRLALQKDRPPYSGWYLYGRTQALHDVCRHKIAINTLIRQTDTLKINEVPPGSGLYSGLYILGAGVDTVRTILETDDFIDYVALLRNYKSGGYYTFSSKALEQYLNYQIILRHGYPEKSRVPSMCRTLF